MQKKMLEIDIDLHERFVKVVALQGLKVKDATAIAIRQYLDRIDYGELVRNAMTFQGTESAPTNTTG